MRLLRVLGRAFPYDRHDPLSVDQRSIAREIALALSPLITRADGAGMPILVYLLGLARGEAEKAARIQLSESDGDAA